MLAEPKLLSKPSQQGVVKVLIVQICRVLDIIFDVDSPLVHTLPVCLTWKIFYHIVKGSVSYFIFNNIYVYFNLYFIITYFYLCIIKRVCYREENDDNEEKEEKDMKKENVTEESNKAAAPVATSTEVVDETTGSTSLHHDSVTVNEVSHATQDIVKTPTAPEARTRSSSSSELLSPMHDHTYALPSLLITPSMMATMDSHSLSHKGYTCLSKVGQITAPPPLPPENNSLKKSVEFLKEAHTHLGT